MESVRDSPDLNNLALRSYNVHLPNGTVDGVKSDVAVDKCGEL